MSTLGEPHDATLPDWVVDALREPMDSRSGSRARIMMAVRTLPAPRRHAAPMRPSRWLRRGLLSPVGGVMTITVLALVSLLRMSTGGTALADIVTVTRILGDSVVPRHVTASVIGGDNHWLDTLRIVEFVIRGSSVRAAAVLGDFNQWRRGVTPLLASGRHEWRARALVPRDALNVAYLVNGSQVIPITAAVDVRD